MPLGTHRQRVPLMLAVACVGMLVYAVAGAAPDDGRELAPAACEGDGGSRTSTTSCDEKDGGGGKGDKDSSTTGKDDCGPTTSTTRKGDSGSGGKDDGKDDGKGDSGSDGKDDGKGDSGSDGKDDDSGGKDGKEPTTTTTAKDDPKSGDDDDADSKKAGGDADVKMTAAAKSDPAAADEKDGEGSKDDKSTSGKDGCGDGKDDGGKDDDGGKGDKKPTTTTTDKDGKDGKDGKGSTTTTLKGGGKDGKEPTTTTTERSRYREPTTSTTTQRGTAGPEAPSGGTGSGESADPGGSPDPGAAPIEPQHVDDSDEVAFGPGPAADDYEMFDPDPDQAGDGWDDFAPLEPEGDDMAAEVTPDEPVLPLFREMYPPSGEKTSARAVRRSRPTGSGGRVQEVAAPPVAAAPRSNPSPGVTESKPVSRRLPGLQTSVTESAFPATVISTPQVFPMNHRDPLAAAALVLLVGVSWELFKAWRRRAGQYWPA